MIKPTVGRVVLFRPNEEVAEELRHAAIVTMVHSNTSVNLAIFNEHGVPYHHQNVTLVQPDDEGNSRACGKGECEWMLYQKGQAVQYDQQLLQSLAKTIEAMKVALEEAGIALPHFAVECGDFSDLAEQPEVGSEEAVLTLDEHQLDNLAMLVHGEARRYCEALGEVPSPEYHELDDDHLEGLLGEVERLWYNSNRMPEEVHNEWLARRTHGGWVYGEELDRENKVSPYMTEYASLTPQQRYKSLLVINAVRGAKLMPPLLSDDAVDIRIEQADTQAAAG